jgi:hypothetical protein
MMKEITPKNSIVPVYLIAPTEEEIAELEKWAIKAEERKVAEQSIINAKHSALAKLAKLGLTEEEAEAVIGL